jgi:hypothetical protein
VGYGHIFGSTGSVLEPLETSFSLVCREHSQPALYEPCFGVKLERKTSVHIFLDGYERDAATANYFRDFGRWDADGGTYARIIRMAGMCETGSRVPSATLQSGTSLVSKFATSWAWKPRKIISGLVAEGGEHLVCLMDTPPVF